MRCGGKLRLDTVTRNNRIEPRHALLCAAVDGRTALVFADDWQQTDVAEISDACATEMGVAEADNDVVADVIA